ncbi:MAG: GntR family transcriptional regulator [Candidatus Aegiribacteria sp.]|nr:GntR family transcriptional regulator [Candidatus Aegiribacteria sp.]MBD3294938.1 GntR family transcriptional regulator [Candidatus Fermentibacteria bacterium]
MISVFILETSALDRLYYCTIIVIQLKSGVKMFRIDPRSAVPVYQQLVRQILRLIVSGDLADGDKLPSIRQLASEVKLNPNTVAKAYRHLENRGFVTSRKGMGVYVSSKEMDLEEDRMEIFRQLTDDFISKAAGLGLNSGEIIEGLRNRLKGDEQHDKG